MLPWCVGAFHTVVLAGRGSDVVELSMDAVGVCKQGSMACSRLCKKCSEWPDVTGPQLLQIFNRTANAPQLNQHAPAAPGTAARR